MTRSLAGAIHLEGTPGGGATFVIRFPANPIPAAEGTRSHRMLIDYDAVVDVCCQAWNAMTADPEHLRSLTNYPWIKCVNI